jgi:hypothetical protein
MVVTNHNRTLFNPGNASHPTFCLGMYERPRNEQEWRTWSDAGINLVMCRTRDDLDEAQEWGMSGWVPVPMVLADDDDGSALGEQIDSLKDHPALMVWEAPDEAILANWRNRAGSRDPKIISETTRAFDVFIHRLERGAAVIRRHDPNHPLWLNEGVISPVDILSRCTSFLDIVGFDYYPVPERTWRPMNLMGPEVSRFRDAAPGKDLWIVQQAFKWSSIGEDPDDFGDSYPSLPEYRFMAWQAILHGATGLLWWGSAYEDRPTLFLDDLMTTVAEIASVSHLIATGPISSVDVRTDRSLRAEILGCRISAHRLGDETLVVLMNEDSHPHEAIITGLDWLDPVGLRSIGGSYGEITSTASGVRTYMEGHETRLYVAE